MSNEKGSVTVGVMVGLGVLYVVLLLAARNGYGYMGYHGYHRGPSFFYWGGPSVYHDPYVRNGSVGNSGRRGGGFGSGK